MHVKYMANNSFSPLSFKKFRFWPPKKKLQNRPLSFSLVPVLAPYTNFDLINADVDTTCIF